jgi:hypothetical protein
LGDHIDSHSSVIEEDGEIRFNKDAGIIQRIAKVILDEIEKSKHVSTIQVALSAFEIYCE